MGSKYSFRIRCEVPGRSGITSDDAELLISPRGVKPEVRLTSKSTDTPLSKSPRFVVRSDGYHTEQNASEAASKYRDVLIRALARFRIAIDFGDRAPKGGFTDAGLRLFEDNSRRRALNDVHGIMTFQTDPPPTFLSLSGAGVRTPAKADRVVRAISDLLNGDWTVSDRERLAYDLFSASFSASTADARFLNLMMATETLIDPKQRPTPVITHVENLLRSTERAPELSDQERASLLGSLRWLRHQSVRQAGRDLAKTLTGKRYRDMAPPDFFVVCYDIRSKLVHGAYPRPSRDEVGSAAASLELFVADLLAGPIRDVEY